MILLGGVELVLIIGGPGPNTLLTIGGCSPITTLLLSGD